MHRKCASQKPMGLGEETTEHIEGDFPALDLDGSSGGLGPIRNWAPQTAITVFADEADERIMNVRELYLQSRSYVR